MRLMALVHRNPGIALAEAARMLEVRYQQLRQVVLSLERRGLLIRRKEDVYRLYPLKARAKASYEDQSTKPTTSPEQAIATHKQGLDRSIPETEDEVKLRLFRYFEERGAQVEVRYGHLQGPDLVVFQGGRKLVIEAKGIGKHSTMQRNYFLSVLGEILRRMSDPNARYAVAFPDHPQYRRLWNRLPAWVKRHLRLTAFFVGEDIEEVS